ncbi:c-type cytochrome [Rhodanobacter ginsengiterrae]|uniref:c-type cytochrome n=1 Tax=Rhodanobacter ginsengiterrae TaxID=2008451 RepID=UPI003CEA70E6
MSGRLPLALLVLASLAGATGLAASASDTARTSPGPQASVEHGRYLVRAGDCMACHTADGGAAFAGGRAVPTPFGVIYSTNITPDRSTGVGGWSGDDFYRAMHEGIARDGHHLYPAFPYPWFTRISRDDVRDIKAYLDTREPVHQVNRPNKLPWPFSMRGLMAAWNGLYLDKGSYQIDPLKSAQWNRGAYLVQGVGHCSACHGDKNLAGAVDKQHPLDGGYAENQFAPALTGGTRDGLGAWSEQDIVDYLGKGYNTRTAAAGPMSEVVQQSTQYLSEPDRRAIAVYLKSFNKTDSKDVAAADKDALQAGSAVYTDNCEACHLRGGKGEAQAFPPLKDSSAVQAEQPDTLIAVILEGGQLPATKHDQTGLAMPAFRERLSDVDVANVATYIRNAWGNRGSGVSESRVRSLRGKLHDSPH